MPNTTNKFKNLMNTRKIASITIPKGIPGIAEVQKILKSVPVEPKNINKYLGGKRSSRSGKRNTKKSRKGSKTRKH